MDNLYNFLIYLGFALILAVVAVIYTLTRYRKMLESMQKQTDEYFKQVMEVVLKNQQKLTEIIVEEIRNKDAARTNAFTQRQDSDGGDQVLKFQRKDEQDG